MFVSYPKIHWINKDDVKWILHNYCYVQEKLDGANLSIRYEKDICIWSRSQVICQDWEILIPFRGACDYVLSHEWIREFIEQNKNARLYWERLVKHTIVYPEKYYNKFYMFDIVDGENWYDIKKVDEIAKEYWIEHPKLIGEWMFTEETIKEIAQEEIRDLVGEWIVIKTKDDFINKRWHRVYAKFVHDKFKEDNHLIFWNSFSGDYEMKFATTYITEARLHKIINKIEQNEDVNIQISDTPKVMWMMYHDAFMEEMWSFAWKRVIDFSRLQILCSRRARLLFHNYLTECQNAPL